MSMMVDLITDQTRRSRKDESRKIRQEGDEEIVNREEECGNMTFETQN